MKLRQKIVISTLLLFMAVFTGANILTIENNCKLSFNRILQQARDEQESISSGIEQYVWAEGEKNGGDARYLNAVMEYLDSRVNTQGTALEILAEDRVLYSTLDFKQPVTVKANYIGRMAEYSRQEIDGKEYLILSSFFPLKDTRIRNLFFVDISGIYADRAQQYAFFLRLAAADPAAACRGPISSHRPADENPPPAHRFREENREGNSPGENTDQSKGMKRENWRTAITKWRMPLKAQWRAQKEKTRSSSVLRIILPTNCVHPDGGGGLCGSAAFHQRGRGVRAGVGRVYFPGGKTD
ncbi:MAG: hypothetical protein ACLUOI_04100 [Eisenbergiella sp.]